MKQFNYYQSQLNKLHGYVQVKFTSEKGSTNYLTLTKESCQEIAKIIPQLEKDNQIIIPE